MASVELHSSLNIKHCINQPCSELIGLICDPKYFTSLWGQTKTMEIQSPILFKGVFITNMLMFQQPLMYMKSFKVFVENQQQQPLFKKTIDCYHLIYSFIQLIEHFVSVFRGSLQPHASHVLDIDVDLNVGKIQKVKFLWNNHVINLLRPKLGASQITVQSGEDGIEYAPFIPFEFYYLCLPINPPMHLYMHPVTHLPIHVSIDPSTHTFLSAHPLNHLPIHLPTHPSIWRSVSSPFWPSVHPSIHPPNYSSQLSIYPSDLL